MKFMTEQVHIVHFITVIHFYLTDPNMRRMKNGGFKADDMLCSLALASPDDT